MILSLLYSAAADVGRELLHLGAFLLLWVCASVALAWSVGWPSPGETQALIMGGFAIGWLFRAKERS